MPRIRAAFEAERDRTVSAVKNANSMVFKFADKNGTSNYIFTVGDGTYTLVQTWESKNIKPTSSVDTDCRDNADDRSYATIIVNGVMTEIRSASASSCRRH